MKWFMNQIHYYYHNHYLPPFFHETSDCWEIALYPIDCAITQVWIRIEEKETYKYVALRFGFFSCKNSYFMTSRLNNYVIATNN